MVGGVIRIVTTIYREELCGLSWSVCGTTTGSLSYFSSLVTAPMIPSSLPHDSRLQVCLPSGTHHLEGREHR